MVYDLEAEKKIGMNAIDETKRNIDAGQEDKDIHWESFTRKFIEDVKNCKVFVDCGAEYGYYTYLAVKYMRDGSIYAFEPEPLRFEMLTEFMKPYKNVKVYPYAISNKNGFEYMFKPKAGSSATFDSNLSQHPTLDGDKIKVSTIALDNMFAKLDIDIIKMDIEGAEVKAFEGMRNILNKRHTKIFIEMHPRYVESIRKGGIAFIDSLLKESGYKVYGVSNRKIRIADRLDRRLYLVPESVFSWKFRTYCYINYIETFLPRIVQAIGKLTPHKVSLVLRRLR